MPYARFSCTARDYHWPGSVLPWPGVSKERSIFFVLPEGSAEISGGNLYNDGLLAALRTRVGKLRVTSPQDWLESDAGSRVVLVDTLNLKESITAADRRVVGEHMVLIVHHLPSLEPGLPEEDVQRKIEDAALPHFSGFLVSSDYTGTLLKERLPGARVLAIEPPLSVVQPAQAFAPGQEPRALMVCNLIARKGVLPFLQELAQAPRTGNFQLDIVGRHDLDPDYAQACKELILGHPELAARVFLRGGCAHDEMPGWYRQASLLVSASKMETFGMALQEARHHGLAILAVDGGNSGAHIRNGETGELCAGPEALARRLLALVEEPEVLAAYSSAAQAQRPAETKSWSHAAERLLETFDSWFGDA